MKKEKIKKMETKQKKTKTDAKNMLIGVGIGIIFGFIFRNILIGMILAIIIVTMLGIGTDN